MRPTTVVVPCYNEERRLPEGEFVAFARHQDQIGLLFVDDGSTDGTATLLERLTSQAPAGLSTLSLARNSGKAEAVRQGIVHVLDHGDVAYTGYWDADLATPLDAIGRFANRLAADDDLLLVMGSRVKLLGRHVHRSEVRHYLGRVFATAASFTLGLAVYDTQCGAKLFRVNPATRSIFRDPFISRWIFDVELLARLARRLAAEGRRVEQAVYEYPLEEWKDVGGSKVKPTDYLLAVRELFGIRRRYYGKRSRE
jgi:dolichyl-phosphate beta-glucosyltransferase